MATVNATMDTNNAGFQLPITIASSGESNYLLRTADTYLNKDITITTSTAAAVPAADNANADVTLFTTDGSNAGVNISAIVGTKAPTEPTSGYYLAFKGSGRSKITTAGWIGTGALNTSTSDEKYFPITAANGSITKVSQNLTPTTSLDKSTTLSWDDSNTSGISVTARGNASGTLNAKINISQAGYVPAGDWKPSSLTIDFAGTPASTTKYLTAVSIASGKSFTVTNAGTLTVTSTGTTTVTSNSTSVGTIAIKAKVTANDNDTTNINIVENGLLKVASPTFSAAPSGGSTASSSQVTMDTTSTSAGIEIQTAYTINAATITYKAAATGWINKAKDASTGSSTTAKSSTNGTKYYVTAITVPKDKKLTVTTSADTALQTNGTEDLDIINNAYRRVDITNNANGRLWIATNKGDVYVRHPTSGSGNVWIMGYNESSDIKVVNNGTRVTTSVDQTKVTSLAENDDTTINTRANAPGTSGWITAGSISPATFASSGTSGVSYVDISKTDAAPVLSSGGKLYINRGYVDNLCISLAKLVPDSISGKTIATAEYIHPDYGAFDENGDPIAGSMTIYQGAYTITT